MRSMGSNTLKMHLRRPEPPRGAYYAPQTNQLELRRPLCCEGIGRGEERITGRDKMGKKQREEEKG